MERALCRYQRIKTACAKWLTGVDDTIYTPSKASMGGPVLLTMMQSSPGSSLEAVRTTFGDATISEGFMRSERGDTGLDALPHV